MLLCRVGRDSLIHEIRDFDSANVDEQTTKRVQDILQPHELHTVRQASNGAAAFYVWVSLRSDFFFYYVLFDLYWAVQAGLLTPLTFARHRLSPLAAFTSGACFPHNGRR